MGIPPYNDEDWGLRVWTPEERVQAEEMMAKSLVVARELGESARRRREHDCLKVVEFECRDWIEIDE